MSTDAKEIIGRRPREGKAGDGFIRLLLAFGLALIMAAGLTGCDEEAGPCCGPDWQAPAAPQGVGSVTGDEEVELYWFPNGEEDLAGYRVYRSTEPDGFFPKIATLSPGATGYMDRNVRNGVTYYYAVSAYDWSGNEGPLSSESVYDTPRPAGYGLRLANADVRPAASGLDFSSRAVLDYQDRETDIFYWRMEDAGAWMIATERSADSYTDIQDAGMRSLDEVSWAPEEGWAPTGEVPLIVGHSYIVWTWDNHFAKFRVVSLGPERVLLDWAYQTDPGNIELSLPFDRRPGHAPGGGLRTHQNGPERRVQS